MHFRFRRCHNLEFQFVVSCLFASGDKPTFKTGAGWCVAHRKGFAWKECRELTPRERNIDFAEVVAMATAKKVTKLLVICRQCDLNLPQRVPTTPEGKNSEVWDTQLSSKRHLEPSPSPNEPSQKKIATPSSDSSFSTPHKAIAPKALFSATPSSKSESQEPPMARDLKSLLSQLEEWQMARPEADLLEDLEEAKEVDWPSKFLRLAAAMGGLKKNYCFVGKARSKDTPLDAINKLPPVRRRVVALCGRISFPKNQIRNLKAKRQGRWDDVTDLEFRLQDKRFACALVGSNLKRDVEYQAALRVWQRWVHRFTKWAALQRLMGGRVDYTANPHLIQRLIVRAASFSWDPIHHAPQILRVC